MNLYVKNIEWKLLNSIGIICDCQFPVHDTKFSYFIKNGIIPCYRTRLISDLKVCYSTLDISVPVSA